MERALKINFKDIYLIPNLISLVRLALTPFIGYFLWRGSDADILICIALFGVAGLSDFFDGIVARRFHKVTTLGIVLDPLCDKVFAVALIVELYFFRGFPFWLALIVVLRDILIVALGVKVLNDKNVYTPSNLTGKYYFASIVLLIFSYTTRFPFGEKLFLYTTVVLWVLSTISYGRRLVTIRRQGKLPIFTDRASYKIARFAVLIIIVAIGFYMFYKEVLSRYVG